MKIRVIVLLTAICLLFSASPSFAKPLKSCGISGYQGGRTLQNVICKDGSPNKNATTFLIATTPSMMKLKKAATFHNIYAAICKDWAKNTGPDLMVTYDFLTALYDWKDKQHRAVYTNYPDCDKY